MYSNLYSNLFCFRVAVSQLKKCNVNNGMARGFNKPYRFILLFFNYKNVLDTILKGKIQTSF